MVRNEPKKEIFVHNYYIEVFVVSYVIHSLQFYTRALCHIV